MSLTVNNSTNPVQHDIDRIRRAFHRDCPNGFCSKRKFMSFVEKHERQSDSNSKSKFNVVGRFIRRQSYRQSRKFFSAMFDIYDCNGDGKLDFKEYYDALVGLTDINGHRIVEILYDYFDVGRKGFITRKEFNSRKKLAAKLMDQYQKDQHDDHLSYDQAFDTMDVNRDGRISKEEFIQWHAKHDVGASNKPVKKRTRILKNLSSLVENDGHLKTSSLQQKIDADRSATALPEGRNDQNNQMTSQFDPAMISMQTDRYLGKVIRRARNKFLKHRFPSSHSINHLTVATNESHSDSGFYTASPKTFHEDTESNTLLDIDDDSLASNDLTDPNQDLICESLEAVLMEAILELRRKREKRLSSLQTKNLDSSTDSNLIVRL